MTGPDPFYVGEVVYLKSGGSALTVCEVHADRGMVGLSYMKSGEVRFCTIPSAALTSEKPTQSVE